MKLLLPLPPSTNGLTKAVYYTDRRTGKRHARKVETTQYTEWKRTAGRALNEQIKASPIRMSDDARIPGPVVLTMRFGRPNKRRQDLDNRLKAPIDLLAAHGVIDDDRNVQSILAYWCSTVEGVEIEVWRA